MVLIVYADLNLNFALSIAVFLALVVFQAQIQFFFKKKRKLNIIPYEHLYNEHNVENNNIDTTVGPREVASAEAASPTVVVEPSEEKVRTRKPRGPYRRYTAHQIEQLFDYVIEQGKTAKDAALLTGINIRTAQHYIKKYNDDEERRLPLSGRKPGAGRKAKLTGCHSQFLIDYVDEHPTAVLLDIRTALYEAFPELPISISVLHRHLIQKCKLTLKKLVKLPAARNSDRVLKLRRERIARMGSEP
jgi:transposase